MVKMLWSNLFCTSTKTDHKCLCGFWTLLRDKEEEANHYGKHLDTFFRAFSYPCYRVTSSLPLIHRLIRTRWIWHGSINLRSHYVVLLHRRQWHEDAAAEHHVTCLPLHLPLLLSLIFNFFICCLTTMLQRKFTTLNFFSTARRAGSTVSALCLYSSTRNIYRYYFWPYAPLPHSPFQVLRLISCCFLGTYPYDLTACPSTNCWGRYVHDPKISIGQNLTDACGIALR